ncbi:MAG: hypothetical protein O7E52_22705 [Candidatus Poribacteria bacterium]|nr:hypothetical protein [Candidatus Poribacteria bacterium]
MKKLNCRLLWLLIMISSLFAPLEAQTQTHTPDLEAWAFFVDMSNYEDVGLPNLSDEAEARLRFRDTLKQVGGYTHLIDVQQKALSEIKKKLGALNERLDENSQLLLYFRGYLSQTADPNAFYLLPQDAILGRSNTSYISPGMLEAWLKPIRTKLQADNILLIVEGYLQAGRALPETNPFNYLGMPTLWRVQSAPDASNVPQSGLLAYLSEILMDENTDLNRDRLITNQEVQQALTAHLPSIRYTRADGLFLKLPSLIEIRRDLSDADFYIDDDQGQRKDVRAGPHRIQVVKSGYRLYEREVDVSVSRGELKVESVSLADLTPIQVYGTVSDAAERPVPNARVKIVAFPLPRITPDREVDVSVSPGELKVEGVSPADLTPIQVDGAASDATEKPLPDTSVTADDEGNFRFENLGPVLTVGKTYQLEAEGEELYRGLNTFVYEGTEDLRCDLTVTQVAWTQLVGERLQRGDCAAMVSHLSVERLSVPEIQSDLDQILACLDSVLESDPENLSNLVYAGTAADLLGQADSAKIYWDAVKQLAPAGSEEAERARERLKQLNPNRTPWVIGVALFVGVAFVGVYLLIRRRGQFKEIPNPYLVGKPISTTDMFFGRRDLFEFIQSRLRGSSQAITIVLYGGRRTGKTSVLLQIFNGALGPTFIPVFVDLQEMAGVNTSGFLKMIAQKTHDAVVGAKGEESGSGFQTNLDSIEGRFDQSDNEPFQIFNDFLRAISLHIEGQYLIFLIDEYEILQTKIESGDLSNEIFSYLRHLMQNRENLAFIFAGSREFERMENRQWAFMFNAAIPRKVSFLRREEAVRLVTGPVKGFVHYTPGAVEKLLRITAGQPYFTQLVCQEVVEYLTEVHQKRVTPEIVEKVSTEIVVANTPYHFAYIWSESSRGEKCVLSALAPLFYTQNATVPPEEIEAKLAEHALDLPMSEIRKALEILTERDLIMQSPYQPNAYYYLMDLTRLWMQSEHSIWSLLNELAET